VAFALTRNWHAALAIGLIEPAVQTIAYTFHERLWARLPGRRRNALEPMGCGASERLDVPVSHWA